MRYSILIGTFWAYKLVQFSTSKNHVAHISGIILTQMEINYVYIRFAVIYNTHCDFQFWLAFYLCGVWNISSGKGHFFWSSFYYFVSYTSHRHTYKNTWHGQMTHSTKNMELDWWITCLCFVVEHISKKIVAGIGAFEGNFRWQL